MSSGAVRATRARSATGISHGDTELLLRGSTVDGAALEGTAKVWTVPSRGRPGRTAS